MLVLMLLMAQRRAMFKAPEDQAAKAPNGLGCKVCCVLPVEMP